MDGDRGSFCFFGGLELEIVSRCFILYLFILALDVFIFYGMYMLGGDIMFFISFIVSCFTCATLIIDLYYEVIHDICLLFSVL